MPNMAATIARHNKALLTQRTEPANTVPPCNCRTKTSCPMKGLCRKNSIIYKATQHQMALPRIITVVMKPNLKLASTTIIRALNVGKNIVSPSCLEPFGKQKTQERTPSWWWWWFYPNHSWRWGRGSTPRNPKNRATPH